MKRMRVLFLATAAALILSGCFGYGSHMGWSGHRGGWMDRHGTGASQIPCEEGERRTDERERPCDSAP